MTKRDGGKKVLKFMRRMRKQDPIRLERFVAMIITFGKPNV